jgi:hypothetical protein
VRPPTRTKDISSIFNDVHTQQNSVAPIDGLIANADCLARCGALCRKRLLEDGASAMTRAGATKR